LGWAAGILLAPYQSERISFQDYAKLLAAFATGFIVSKADRTFEVWIDQAKTRQLFDEQLSFRLMVFGASFMVAMVTTYVGRKYFRFGPDAEKPGE
jgi:hypothetical protein